jgi:hypothetical protein
VDEWPEPDPLEAVPEADGRRVFQIMEAALLPGLTVFAAVVGILMAVAGLAWGIYVSSVTILGLVLYAFTLVRERRSSR